MIFCKLQKQCKERIEILSLLNKNGELNALVKDYKMIVRLLKKKEYNLIYYSLRWNYTSYFICENIDTYLSLSEFAMFNNVESVVGLSPISFYYKNSYVTIK